MIRLLLSVLFGFLMITNPLFSQTTYSLKGKVLDAKKKDPVEFAAVALGGDRFWTMTNEKGEFLFQGVPQGKFVLRVSSLGYVEAVLHLDVQNALPNIEVLLHEKNLALNEVVVTAQSETTDISTSYVMDRTTLDHAQILNVSDITGLLPGGKTSTVQKLTSENPIYLQALPSEKGNATFGTAIEIDGVRLANNTGYSEDGSATTGIDTRNISSVNIESVEVVTGIPSVEYGDLSNGIVRFSTRKGKTPYIVELATKPHTKQVAVSKGFSLGEKNGVFNTSLDHTESVSKIYSPYTTYDRNTLSLNYSNTFNRGSRQPIRFSFGLTGNVGGYDSQQDPDSFKDSYRKQRDNTLRANFQLRYLVGKSWITNLELSGSLVMSDKQTEELRYRDGSVVTAMHALEEGYFMAVPYETNPSAPVILIKPGYWSELSFFDSKPIDYTLKLKADWVHKFGNVRSKLLGGVDFVSSGNRGKGKYYDDYSVAPDWREYRFDKLPFINNAAIYLEEKVLISLKEQADLEIMAGVRSDITDVNQSEYGMVNAFSPRLNVKYNLKTQSDWLRSLSIYGGWGKAVKLPSFEVLYPKPSYYDQPVFASPTLSDLSSSVAYYTCPYQLVYNPDLKWQYTSQFELGVQANIKGTRISVSAYRKKTYNPYMAVNVFTPFTYKYTGEKALSNLAIAPENREYFIDRQSGIVSVGDKTGAYETQMLPYIERNTYKGNKTFTNGSAVERRGVDWIVDFAPLKQINTSFRIDGNYYYYKGLDETLIASRPNATQTMLDGRPYQYVGYYVGSSVSSTYSAASASVSNGNLSKRLNTNLTITTHIPKIRLIISLRIESSLYRYNQSLSEYSGGTRGYAIDTAEELIGTDTDIYGRDKYVIVYPSYYSTWENPEERIPFLEKFIWAKENDPTLYADLKALVVKSNYAYNFNPSRISAYYSANINITKEIGDVASISFYANNFLNSLKRVTNSNNGLDFSLYESNSYIPSFYYGLSLRLKL